MGILNVTPDSFADAAHLTDAARAVDAALRMEADGADLIDVGGESTRPGAEPVSATEELARILPVLRGLAGRLRIPVSVDTYKADIARAALDADQVRRLAAGLPLEEPQPVAARAAVADEDEARPRQKERTPLVALPKPLPQE